MVFSDMCSRVPVGLVIAESIRNPWILACAGMTVVGGRDGDQILSA